MAASEHGDAMIIEHGAAMITPAILRSIENLSDLMATGELDVDANLAGGEAFLVTLEPGPDSHSWNDGQSFGSDDQDSTPAHDRVDPASMEVFTEVDDNASPVRQLGGKLGHSRMSSTTSFESISLGTVPLTTSEEQAMTVQRFTLDSLSLKNCNLKTVCGSVLLLRSFFYLLLFF